MKEQFFKNVLSKHDYVEFFTEDFSINKLDEKLENLPDKQMGEVVEYVIDALEQDLQKYSSSERKINEMKAKLT